MLLFEKDTRHQFNAMMPTINMYKQTSDCGSNKKLWQALGLSSPSRR